MSKRIGIIGGGSAGLMLAIMLMDEDVQITIFEHRNTVAGKFLMTGNGKCNITNDNLDINEYYSDDPEKLKRIINAFSPRDLKTFLKNNGIPTISKGDYVYPYTESARDIYNLFELLIKKHDVDYVLNSNVVKAIKKDDKFIVETHEGLELSFDYLVLAGGGKAYPKTGSDGSIFKIARSFGINPTFTYPVLVPLKCENFISILMGLRVNSALTAYVDGEEVYKDKGNLQFTEYGLSGIVTFQVSRYLTKALEEGKKCEVSIDFLADDDLTLDYYLELSQKHSDFTLENLFGGSINKKLLIYLLKAFIVTNSKVKEEYGLLSKLTMMDLNKDYIKEFYEYVRNYRVRIIGHMGYDHAQCTRGGVRLQELSDNLESLNCKGLYVIGEMINVDGPCGGYNLQWAFSSAHGAYEGIIKD